MFYFCLLSFLELHVHASTVALVIGEVMAS